MSSNGTTLRVGVIGCGVVGASVGCHLARGGAQVTWFESGSPGMGTSNSSFGWANASSAAHDPEYFEFRWSAMEEWKRVHQAIGGDDWWHPTGHLRWDDGAIADDLRSEFEHAVALGYPGESLDVERARALEPDVDFGSAGWVAHFPSESWIDPRNAAARLVEAGLSLGADLRASTQVAAIETTSNRVSGVRLVDGDRAALDVVVNCAGPDAGSVAAMVGRTLPMLHDPGFVVRLGCEQQVISRVMHAPHVELRPDGDRRVLVHSRLTDAEIVEDADRDRLAHHLVALGVEVVPRLADAAVLDARIGRRPIPGDEVPSVGGIEMLPGYYEAVMHSGVTLAALVGKLLTETILGESQDDRLSRYRPDRFE